MQIRQPVSFSLLGRDKIALTLDCTDSRAMAPMTRPAVTGASPIVTMTDMPGWGSPYGGNTIITQGIRIESAFIEDSACAMTCPQPSSAIDISVAL